LTNLPDEPDGAPDIVEPACGQPEVPKDAAPLTLSTISSFDGGCRVLPFASTAPNTGEGSDLLSQGGRLQANLLT
jgi:hypothetical protein